MRIECAQQFIRKNLWKQQSFPNRMNLLKPRISFHMPHINSIFRNVIENSITRTSKTTSFKNDVLVFPCNQCTWLNKPSFCFLIFCCQKKLNSFSSSDEISSFSYPRKTRRYEKKAFQAIFIFSLYPSQGKNVLPSKQESTSMKHTIELEKNTYIRKKIGKRRIFMSILPWD